MILGVGKARNATVYARGSSSLGIAFFVKSVCQGGNTMQMVKHILFRGILFLIPIGFLGFILGQLLKATTVVAQIADRVIPIERVAGIGLTSVLAVVFLIMLCLLAGLFSYLAFINNKVLALDRVLSQSMPGYTFVKGIFGSASASSENLDSLKPVLVTYDDTRSLAFEVDRTGDLVVVFHPEIPSVLAGTIAVVDQGRVEPFPIPAHQVLSMLRTHGRGMGKVLEKMSDAKSDDLS